LLEEGGPKMTRRRQWGQLGGLTLDGKVMGPFEVVVGEGANIMVRKPGNCAQKS